MPATCDAAPDFLADTEYPGVLAELRAAFTEGKLRSYEARDAQLRRLLTMLKDNQEAILKAVIADLKAPDDALLELKYLVSQTCYAIQNLKSWMKPTYVAKTLRTCPLSSPSVPKPPHHFKAKLRRLSYQHLFF